MITGIDMLTALLDKFGSVDWNINDRTDRFTVISKSGFTKKSRRVRHVEQLHTLCCKTLKEPLLTRDNTSAHQVSSV